MTDNIEALVQQMLLGNIYLEEAIELLERSMIKCAMESAAGNQSQASKRLGIHRNTLQKKLLAYGLSSGRARRKTPTRQGRPRRSNSGAA